jgi:chromosomal replication initiation ATPase DnaA
MRKYIQKTYHKIADEFDMDHATVIYAEKQINNLLFRDKKLQREIEEIENILKLNN